MASHDGHSPTQAPKTASAQAKIDQGQNQQYASSHQLSRPASIAGMNRAEDLSHHYHDEAGDTLHQSPSKEQLSHCTHNGQTDGLKIAISFADSDVVPSPLMRPGTISESTMYEPTSPYRPVVDQLPSRYTRKLDKSLDSCVESQRQSTECDTANHLTQLTRPAGLEQSKYRNDFTSQDCPSHAAFNRGEFDWVTFSIWVLAIFSLALSGFYLGVAIKGPRWDGIHDHGYITGQSAAVLVSVFARLIEMSFVTLFVIFLGQVLSRRAFNRDTKGVSLAELCMRNWILQPGTIFTHPETIKFAAATFLGVTTLVVAVVATLYVPASSALINPVLTMGDWKSRSLWGNIKTSFGNRYYLAQTCRTPIIFTGYSNDQRSEDASGTCLALEHASRSYHNYQEFLSQWTDIVKRGIKLANQYQRPQPYGLFLQNTTVNGTWIYHADTVELSKQYNRTVNNVTLAMPHTGIFQAARDSRNNILQPTGLEGNGVYHIRAALPSPYLNVLCTHVTRNDISSMVYETATQSYLNGTIDLPTNFTTRFNWANFSSIKTPVDGLFDWNNDEIRPVFYKFPKPYNTILNNTGPYGLDGIYLLGTGPPIMSSSAEAEHLLCKARAGLISHCSTQYNVTAIGGTMAVYCDDETNKMIFKGKDDSRIVTKNDDWRDVIIGAFNALALNTGVSDANASNAHMLMELMLQKPELNPGLPSPAEALAIMGGSTLLMSSQDSPFVTFWNYTRSIIDPGEYQNFEAEIQIQGYVSGGTLPIQKGFLVVLFTVFILNLFIVSYMIVHHGQVTDYTDTPNLFAILINSPPHILMRGSCGAGPTAPQYGYRWGVEMEDDHCYMTDRPDSAYSSATTPTATSMFSSRRSKPWFFGGIFKRRNWKPVPSSTITKTVEVSPTITHSPMPRAQFVDSRDYFQHETSYAGACMADSERIEMAGINPREHNLSRAYSKIAKPVN